MASTLPAIRLVPLSDIASLESTPLPKIHTDHDVETWRSTRAYHDYAVFLRRLNESVVGHYLPWASPSHSQAVANMIDLLDTLDRWIDDIPPLETPQRFGNLAFRTWGKRLEERVDGLLASLLPPDYAPAIPQVKPYFLTSFGSFTRMDYGTGHETSFALFLLCLILIRFFQPVPDEERELVLRVFVRYLRLCWRLQDTYKLEPAGSHGVWGLDDSSFLGYIFGSGQLRDQTQIPVSAVLHPPLPATNLYFMSIMRIHEVKHGPFHEHSSQLHSIAVGVPNWGKVNSGLFKMYEAEVLGKRVVVQHIPLGGLLEWEITNAVPDVSISGSTPRTSAGTRAPWASSPSTSAVQHGSINPSTLPATSLPTLIPGASTRTTGTTPGRGISWNRNTPAPGQDTMGPPPL